MKDTNHTTCIKCILPIRFPGIVMNKEGLCNYCAESRTKTKIKGEQELEEILRNRNNARYDCIVPLSGGKDSTYVLCYAVKKLGLRPIAVNYNSGFQSKTAIDNISRACIKLKVPLIRISSNMEMRLRLIKQVLRIANCIGVPFGVCGNCEAMIRNSINKVAQEYNLYLVLYGDTKHEKTIKGDLFGSRGLIKRIKENKQYRGLIPIMKYLFFLSCERISAKMPLSCVFRPSSLPKKAPNKILIIHFYDYVKWEPGEIMRMITSEVGWRYPEGKLDRFDCLLHPFDNIKWLRDTGITKDGFIYSNMIREGYITKQEALDKEKALEKDIYSDCLEYFDRFSINNKYQRWIRSHDIENKTTTRTIRAR